MYQRIKPHLPQFLFYLVSGGSAAAIELTSYKVMLLLGIHYLVGAVLSSFLGLLSAFLFHKYFVFRKKEQVMNHAIRYIILQAWNIVAQTVIVFLIVDVAGSFAFVQAIFQPDALVGSLLSIEVFAKIASIGTTVSWNFLLYKYLVYV
ncbi:MAG: hypothetical protein Greene041619_52 [Candidatus Peregrinibacteria bacterium Greene0416_19]|nr:MAG: hypothetical protein Greene041619_52 [Candidatus Peregrinibacteria bacterium Greene0416_19]